MDSHLVDCNHFPSKTWVHLVWTLERVGNQVHYAIDTYSRAEPEEIDIAFQIDGNYKQQPYSVWLDEVTLNAY